MTAASAEAAPAPARAKSFHHGITYTSYEVNTFQLKFNTSGACSFVAPGNAIGNVVARQSHATS